MKKFEKVCLPNVPRAEKLCRLGIPIAATAGIKFRKLFSVLAVSLLSFQAVVSELPEDKLNLIFYQFLDESDELYLEIVPGDRFQLPLIRGYQVRIDYNKIEIITLSDRDVVEPDGMIMPSGHVAQMYNLGWLSTIEYELLIHFDHQTDRYFIALRDDTIRVSTFRDEFTNVIVP